MKTIDEWSDTDLFTFINWVNIVEDVFVVMPCVVLLIVMKKAPSFVVKGLVLVMLSCIVDAIYQGASIYFTHPSLIFEVFLYTLTGIDTFIDVSIYWIIAFMYWITAINIAEFN